MPHKKGMKMKGMTPGQKLAYDDTMDYKKPASATTKARATTTKGNARKTAPVGSRKAYDGTVGTPGAKTKKLGGGLAGWRAAVKKANDKLGTKGIPRKGTKAYAEAKRLYK